VKTASPHGSGARILHEVAARIDGARVERQCATPVAERNSVLVRDLAAHDERAGDRAVRIPIADRRPAVGAQHEALEHADLHRRERAELRGIAIVHALGGIDERVAQHATRVLREQREVEALETRRLDRVDELERAFDRRAREAAVRAGGDVTYKRVASPSSRRATRSASMRMLSRSGACEPVAIGTRVKFASADMSRPSLPEGASCEVEPRMPAASRYSRSVRIDPAEPPRRRRYSDQRRSAAWLPALSTKLSSRYSSPMPCNRRAPQKPAVNVDKPSIASIDVTMSAGISAEPFRFDAARRAAECEAEHGREGPRVRNAEVSRCTEWGTGESAAFWNRHGSRRFLKDCAKASRQVRTPTPLLPLVELDRMRA